MFHTVLDPSGKVVANDSIYVGLPLLGTRPLAGYVAPVELPVIWSGLRRDNITGLMNESGVWYSPDIAEFLTQASKNDVLNPYRFNGGDPIAAVSTAFSNIAAERQRQSWEAYTFYADIGHRVLDTVGIVDPTGIADGVNGAWYLGEAALGREGAALNAGISFFGAVLPYAGDAIKVMRGGATAVKGCDTIRTLTSTERLARGGDGGHRNGGIARGSRRIRPGLPLTSAKSLLHRRYTDRGGLGWNEPID